MAQLKARHFPGADDFNAIFDHVRFAIEKAGHTITEEEFFTALGSHYCGAMLGRWNYVGRFDNSKESYEKLLVCLEPIP